MTLKLAPRPNERLSALERLEVLCDPGSLSLLRTQVRSRRMGEKARAGDGVLGGSGLVDGRPVAVFAQDSSYAGGSLGEVHADTVLSVLRLAGRARMPVVGFVDSAGARMQEGLAALSGYAQIFAAEVGLSGRVPQIAVVCGASAGGAAYGPALTDFTVMTERASMFLTGPGVVERVTGEQTDAASLGGPRVHQKNGVCHLVAPSDVDAALLTRDLIDYLPQHADQPPVIWPAVEPPGYAPDAVVPLEERRVYDVREVARALVDGGRMLEISPRWARNVVCAFARIDGRAVGIVANQPNHLGGVLDSESAQKAARFVRTCNLFGVPLLVLVDTPGFLPGPRQESGAVIRHGAKLVHAFAECTVPRVTVIIRKAFGGAFIAMNSRDLGADVVLAWPSAQLGVMGARQAVEIIHRRQIAAADRPERARDVLAAAYAQEHLHPDAATADGYVDEVIAPTDTRARVAAAFTALQSASRPARSAGNLPL